MNTKKTALPAIYQLQFRNSKVNEHTSPWKDGDRTGLVNDNYEQLLARLNAGEKDPRKHDPDGTEWRLLHVQAAGGLTCMFENVGGKQLLTQYHERRIIRTGKDGNGNRMAKIIPVGSRARPAFMVPMELCKLAAGKDAWMQLIAFRCTECSALTLAGELGDVDGMCERCSEDYFKCDKCNDSHHPDDPCPAKAAATVAEAK